MATVSAPPVRAGRGTEFVLLVLAVTLGVGVHVIAGLTLTGEVLPSTLHFAATLGGVALVLHILLRWRAPYADQVILPLTIALNGIGIGFLYRLDITFERLGRSAGYGPRQLMWLAIGALLATLVLLIVKDHRLLRRLPFLSMVGALVLLVLPLVPGIGRTVNGSTLWIEIGPLTFQPAEVAKILLAIFFAGYLVINRDTLTLAGPRIGPLQLPRFKDFGPILLVWAASVGILVFQRDLGTSLLFFGMFVAMLYVATERLSWILIGLILFIGGVIVAVNTFGHVAARFDVWLDALSPELYNRNPGGSGQLVQGLFGLANGGLFGAGIGQGYPSLVQFSQSDFIFTTIGEELGLTGAIAILLMYLLICQRGLRTAIGVRDGFGKLLASGLAFAIAFQVFVVVGGVTRVIPLTGLTMPFLAAGGSSLVANWMIIALLLRMSDGARRPAITGEVPMSDQTMHLAVVSLQAPEPAYAEMVIGETGAGQGRPSEESAVGGLHRLPSVAPTPAEMIEEDDLRRGSVASDHSEFSQPTAESPAPDGSGGSDR